MAIATLALLGSLLLIVPCAAWRSGPVAVYGPPLRAPVAANAFRRRVRACRTGGRCSLGSVRSSAGMARSEAERVLGRFDQEQQRIAKEGFGGEREGFGGGTSAAKWAAAYPDWPALRGAVLALAGESEKVMMGICADDAFEGVAALKEWVGALELPRGRLHGMDKEGEPMDMKDFGSVFIKYTSTGGQISDSGDAMLNGYTGSYRGVYFNPVLADGEFRQYAVLPLFLFDSRNSKPSHSSDTSAPSPPPAPTPSTARPQASAAPASSSRSPSPEPAPAPPDQGAWTKSRVEQLIAPLSATLTQLDASIQVLAVDDSSAAVCLDFSGPDVLKFGITNALQEGGVKQVVFSPEELPATDTGRGGGGGANQGARSDTVTHNVMEYDGPDL